eukprot:11821594-Alexandrium_andersonii.AAC.1
MVFAPEARFRPLDVARLMVALRRAPANAGGPDGWMPSELRNLPRCAAVLLVEFYAALSRG